MLPVIAGEMMKKTIIIIGVPVIVALLGIFLLLKWWLTGGNADDISLRAPIVVTTHSTPATPGDNNSATDIPSSNNSTTSDSSAAITNITGSWQGFRGVNRDNVVGENGTLARNWGTGKPKELWSVKLGEGYAGAAVINSRVYVLDYDQQKQSDVLRCLALADGKELWSTAYQVNVKRNHGMSRTVPAVTEKYVVSLGPKCHLLCVDALSGKEQWKYNLVADYGAEVPPWYAGQCPLIDGNRVIISPGGKALMVAFDLATGKEIWRTPNPNGWKMTHSSIMPATLNGEKMYLYCASGGVVGVSAKDGALRWETSDWRVSTATIPTPLPIGDGRIFITGGYNAGSIMLRINYLQGQYSAETLFRLRANVFSSDQQTPILYNNHIYGVIAGGQMVCLDLQGKQKWNSGGGNRYGLGPYLIADGMIYVMNDNGLLTILEATPSQFHKLAEAKVLDGPDAWGPFALAGSRLLARDLNKMVCLDVGK